MKKILGVLIMACTSLSMACGNNLMGPGGAISPTVSSPVISVPAGVDTNDLHEGDQITVSVSVNPGTGSVVVAFVLVREDGAAMRVMCGPVQGVGTVAGTVTFRGTNYLWIKGHTLNGASLQADFEDRNAAFQGHGCYFLDADQNPFSVHFERGKRTDVALNWWAN